MASSTVPRFSSGPAPEADFAGSGWSPMLARNSKPLGAASFLPVLTLQPMRPPRAGGWARLRHTSSAVVFCSIQNWLFKRQHAGVAAVAAQLEAAARLRLHRHQHAGGEGEQAAEVVGGDGGRRGRGGVGEPRGVDAQRAAVGQAQAVQGIAAALVIDAAHDQASALAHIILARRRTGRAGEDADLVGGALRVGAAQHFHPAPAVAAALKAAEEHIGVVQAADPKRGGVGAALAPGPLALS